MDSNRIIEIHLVYESHSWNPRAYYSPYALGLYLEAVDRVERMIAEGDLVPVACNHVFSGPVLKAVLQAIGEVA